MLMHRVMTLGHIVSTTSIRFNVFRKGRKFDGEHFVDKHGIQMIKTIAKSYQVQQHFFSNFS
jgi:hypothetical protein